MPIIAAPLVYLGVGIAGAIVGGSGVWAASDAAQKVTTAALVGTGLYLFLTRRGK